MTSSYPSVTVLLCVYNGEVFLEGAIQSILNQTWSDFEFLIINDGSTDSSWEIIDKYRRRDSRIVAISKENQGLTKSLNLGLKMARGDWIARQDSDDFSLPNRLEYCLKRARGRTLIVTPWINVVDGKSRVPRSNFLLRYFPKRVLFYLLSYFNFLAHGTYFFNRTLALDLGGYREQFKAAQDYDFLLRMIEAGGLEIVPFPLYGLRLHGASVSQQNRLRQAQLAFMASIFGYERRRSGSDSYSLIDGTDYGQLIRHLARSYCYHSLFVSLFMSVRLKDFSLIKCLVQK